MKVKDILRDKSPDIISISPDQTVQDASKILSELNIGVLIVLEDNQPVGILSERDIVRNLGQSGPDCLTVSVKDVMTTDLIIAVPDDELNYVSNTMTNKRIRHLPVMKDDQLVGIISIGDIVKAQLEFYEGEARSLMQYISGNYA